MPVQAWSPGQVLTAAQMTSVTNLVLYPTSLAANLNPGVVGNLYVCTANLTLTLPSPASAGQLIGMKVRGTSVTVTINRNSSDVIYGSGVSAATSITIAADGAMVALESDGTNWHIVDGAVDSGWVTPSYSNSFNVIQYRQIGNIVRLRGLNTTGTSGTTAFTLPAGFRPTATVGFYVLNGSATTGFVTITTAGVVAATWALGTGVYTDPVHFPLD